MNTEIISCSMFLFEWLVTMFATVFEPEGEVQEVIDSVIQEGLERQMVKVAIGITIMVGGEGEPEVNMVRLRQAKVIIKE